MISVLSYKELLAENEKLKKENAYLKNELKKYIKSPQDAAPLPADLSEITVNKSSSSQQKIELFKTLFVGRTDVFARRWYSTTTEKSGYQPVCANEWAE